MDKKRLVKTGYNTIASKYLAVRNEKPENVQVLQKLMEILPESAKILDAGCGAGIPVTEYLSQFFDIIGVDFSEVQVRLAHRLVPRAQFICQDMTNLAFRDNTFDAICSYYAIIHIPRKEHRRLLMTFYRLLNPTGLIFLCMGANDIVDDIAEDYLGSKMYWSHYNAETNIQLLIKCGFKILQSHIIPDPTYSGAEHLFVLAQKAHQSDKLA